MCVLLVYYYITRNSFADSDGHESIYRLGLIRVSSGASGLGKSGFGIRGCCSRSRICCALQGSGFGVLGLSVILSNWGCVEVHGLKQIYLTQNVFY